MRHLGLAIILCFFGTVSVAKDITNRDELHAYLTEQLTTDVRISDTYSVGSKFRVFSHNQSCFGPKSLNDLPLPLRIMRRQGAVFFEEVGRSNHGFQIMNSPGCTLKLSGFNDAGLSQMNLKQQKRNDGTAYVRVPYAKQEYLGIEEVSFRTSYIGDHRCDISFIPWFRNYDPSYFVNLFEDEFRKDYRLKAVFSEEAKTRKWCLKRKFDGSFTWLVWSRY